VYEAEIGTALDQVGPRLRTLRRQRQSTLAEVSASTGISVSTLSRLEAGARRPTLELMLPLAKTYGVTLDDLVGAPPTGDPRIHLRPISAHGMTMLPLTRRAGGIQAYKMIIPAGSDRRQPELKTHDGYEWLYVLNGRLRLVLGEHDMHLEPIRTRSNFSASSAPRASAPTCACGRPRSEPGGDKAFDRASSDVML
jgi:transcriptional regulator with XRE-family HTH domain